MDRSSTLSALLVVALLLPGSAEAYSQTSTAQTSPGRLVGTVFDSTRSEPLADARVVLWETSHQAITDEEGRFTMEGVPAGTYSVVFFHERLARLGVSSGARSVDVRPNRTVTLDLGTPSMVTIQKIQCVLERGGRGGAGGTATGRVRDTRTGVALPRAQVILTWRSEETGQLEKTRATADQEGWYRHCRVPRGQVVGARARFLDRSGTHREFSLGADSGAVRMDFYLDDLTPSDVSGTIRDAGSGEAVGDAEVVLRGTGFKGITDDDGGFSFEDVPPGTYSVEISHLAYGTRTDTVQVGTDLDVEMAIDVSMQPVELAPIQVTAEARDVEEALAMGGEVISRDAIDQVRHRSRDVGDLLRSQHVRGLVVRRQGNDICVGFMPGQARMRKSNCQPAVVFIDGARQTVPRVAMDLNAEAVDRIILYRPVEAGNLFGLGSASGVIKIITRSADRPRSLPR